MVNHHVIANYFCKKQESFWNLISTNIIKSTHYNNLSCSKFWRGSLHSFHLNQQPAMVNLLVWYGCRNFEKNQLPSLHQQPYSEQQWMYYIKYLSYARYVQKKKHIFRFQYSQHFKKFYLSAVPPAAPLLWKAGFLKARFISAIF